MRNIRLLILTGLLFIVLGLTAVPLSLAGTGTITDNGVNVRSGPGTDYSILNTLAKGTAVTILDTSGDWRNIQYGSLKGWVMSRFISAGGTAAAETPYRLRVTGDLVNLRKGPDTGYDMVGQVRKGDILTVVDLEGNWYHIKTAGGLDAYIRSDYVAKESAASPAAPVTVSEPAAASAGYVKVVEGPVNVRSAADSGSAKITMVDSNTVFPVLGREGDWYKIRLSDGKTGYIAAWLVQATSTAPASAASAAGSEKPIAVILDGKTLSFDVAPVIVNGTTLVPLRGIFEALGASVKWDGASQKVTAVRGDTTVILTVGSASPTINGQAVKIAVPARLIKDRTMVPMRFVAEAFGAEVGWNGDTRTVTITSPKTANKDGLGPGENPLEANPIAPDAIRLSRIKDETGLKISMQSGAELKGEIDEDDGKVTYEFPGRHIDGLFYFEEPIGKSLVKVRGKSEDDKAVIEIEFPDNAVYKTASENGGKTEVCTIVNSILNVEQEKLGSSGEKIIITTATPVKYTHQRQGDSIVINLPNLVRGQAHEEYKYEDELLKNLKISEDKDQTVITVNTVDLSKYTTGLSNSNSTDLVIMLAGKGQVKERNNNLVVLDPGHGGKDTGARGATLNEKDVNLAVALQVGEILKQKGVQVEYTRQTDEFIDLEPRADIANKLNAGLFVSIHSNANPDNSKQGTETYYYAPMEVPDLYLMQDERKNLATAIHQKLTAAIRRPDRGVKTANFSVLRNTRMPSVLVEMAFISNPDEEALLKSDGFRNQAASAIAGGILQYMGK